MDTTVGIELRADIRCDTSGQVWGMVSETDGLVLADGSNGLRVIDGAHWQNMGAMTDADPDIWPLATGKLTHARLREQLGLPAADPVAPYCPAHHSYEWCEHNGGGFCADLD